MTDTIAALRAAVMQSEVYWKEGDQPRAYVNLRDHVRAALAAADDRPETADTGSSNYTIRASLDEGETIVREMEVNALEQKLSGRFLDLDSPEAAEALARELQETVLTFEPVTGPGMGAYRKSWVDLTDSERRHARQDAAAVLAALREQGR